jgi:hypothetical protein
LYKEIVETSNRIKSASEVKKEAKLKEKMDNKPVRTTSGEITNMQNEIDDLKKDVKEMLRLMNALYDFESQEAP